MKKSLLILLFAIGVSYWGWGQIISQYVETNSGTVPKGIEIWNNTTSTLDFSVSNLIIQQGTNGAALTDLGPTLINSGTLVAGDVLVIGTSDIGTYLTGQGLTSVTFLTYAFNFNGDDALAVKFGGVVTDIFGNPGSDPGTSWLGSGVNTANQNIALLSGITTGSSIGWTDPSLRFSTISTTPATLPEGLAGFGIAPAAAGTPDITVSPVLLVGFDYGLGNGPSAQQTFTVEGTDLTANILVNPSTNYEISIDNITYQLTTITLAQTGGTVATTTIYTRLQTGLGLGNYNENINITSTGATDKIVSCSGSVIIPATSTLPFVETFDIDLGDCYPYSVSGATKNWIWNSGGYAYISGYNSGETEEDWLVLPGINLNNYANEFMTFETWYQYGSDDANNYLKLYYSTDYFGVGNPTTATWTELPYTQPAASQVWTSSGYVDLTGINGTMVYIAFKYNYEVTKYRNWGVDNISIMEYDLVNWANLQHPGNGNITVGTTFTVYAQCWEPGVTDSPGQGAGIAVWIGYSSTNTNPSTWTDWVPATYSGDVGNNDEYSLDLGLEILTSGIYYYASRFQLNTAPFQYGGFSGGFWNGTTNVSGVLTVNPPSAQIDWANLQWPPNGNITLGGDFVVYAQVYEPGVTDLVGQGADITAWIGYSTSNTDPSTWSDWVPATYNVDAGGNDEYMANIGDAISSTGTIYYASRFKLGLADYVYGGYVGGFWDGVNNVSGELTVNAPEIVINEVDSDTPSTDVLEFVELFDGGVGNTNLNGLVVVFYNGSNDLSYAAYDLDGYSTDANGYFVLGNIGVANVDYVFNNGSLQNGQDAVALYLGDAGSFSGTAVTTTNLLDALVYDNGQADDPGLLVLLNSGEPQINENGRSNGANHSNQRIPNGSGGQRNTSTYDQAFPTPGVINLPIYTNWTGTLNNIWDESGNWDNGVPTILQDAIIPNVAKAPFPVITGSATCANLTMNLGSSLEIGTTGSLTVTGTFTNNGSLTIKSDATGTGSLIENNGVSATVERYYTGNEWHLISSPVTGATANMFLGLYLQNHTESTNLYTDIVDPLTPLSVTQGYALWNYNTATAQFTGNLNTGAMGSANNLTRSGADDPDPGVDNFGWNLLGNPYPSSIDWFASSGWTKTNVDNALYIHVNSSTWATFIAGVGVNGGTQFIAPGQGFFVHISDGGGPYPENGTMQMSNSVRVHNNTTFFKDALTNLVRLEVSGNGYTDETVIRFHELSTAGFDGEYDAYKLFGIVDEAAQIYSIGSNMLSINSLPETETVNLGMKVNVDGLFTIAATEILDLPVVILEDTETGIITDLKTGSYTFNFSAGQNDQRFVLHFTPLAIPENADNVSSIYAQGTDVYVVVKENTEGNIFIYNVMGQEVASSAISGTINKLTLNKSAYYIVKVLSNENVVTKKVFIK